MENWNENDVFSNIQCVLCNTDENFLRVSSGLFYLEHQAVLRFGHDANLLQLFHVFGVADTLTVEEVLRRFACERQELVGTPQTASLSASQRLRLNKGTNLAIYTMKAGNKVV